MAFVAHYLRAGCPHQGGALRVSPDPALDKVCAKVKPYTPLFIYSWDIVNGFICVRLHESEQAPPYWVLAKHVLVRHSDEWRCTFVDDDMWFESMQFEIPLDQLSIRASDGHAELATQDELDDYNDAIPEKKRPLYELYTYVSLEMGCIKANGGYVCSRPLHITIGYFPRMSWADTKRLKARLQETLERWQHLEARERPFELLKLRQFEYKQYTDDPEDSSVRIDVATFTESEVAQHLEDGRLHLCFHNPDKGRSHAEEALRLYDRDFDRVTAALERARDLPYAGPPSTRGTIVMESAASGLGNSTELRDLLFYLTDACMYSPECYCRIGKSWLFRGLFLRRLGIAHARAIGYGRKVFGNCRLYRCRSSNKNF